MIPYFALNREASFSDEDFAIAPPASTEAEANVNARTIGCVYISRYVITHISPVGNV